MKLTERQVERFLREVDASFPIPLSQKQNLREFAQKLCEKATLCIETKDGRVLAMAAGYTDCVIGNKGYLSLVATVEEARGRGLAPMLIKKFLKISEEKNLDAVHLYAVQTNEVAIRMYERLGFEKWILSDEPRPEDVHLIYRFKKEDCV